MNTFGFNKHSLNRKKLYLDIGSANTVIFLDKKEIFSEPTCIAYHKETDSVVAVGKKALSLLGKTPRSIIVSFPVQHGVISNTRYFELFLTAVLKQVLPDDKLSRLIFGLSGKVAVMSSISPAKKRLLKNLLKKVGFSGLKLIDSSYAAAISVSGGDKKQLNNTCIIDIGAQKTEIAVFSMGELVSSQNFKCGGIQLTEALQKISRSQYKCVVGWHLAEEAKKQIGTLVKGKDKVNRGAREGALGYKFVIRGKDIVNQSGKTVVFSSEDTREEFNKIFNELLDNIQNFIATLPSETAVSVLEKGIFLTGGASILKGIDSAIINKLKCDVFLSSNPKKDVVNGLLV